MHITHHFVHRGMHVFCEYGVLRFAAWFHCGVPVPLLSRCAKRSDQK
jgi:hypothetical protein